MYPALSFRLGDCPRKAFCSLSHVIAIMVYELKLTIYKERLSEKALSPLEEKVR
jgi:hypothetical protein